MRRRTYELIKKQSKVKVVARTQASQANRLKAAVLTAASAGAFYFFGYNLWHALTGG